MEVSGSGKEAQPKHTSRNCITQPRKKCKRASSSSSTEFDLGRVHHIEPQGEASQ